MSFEKDIGGPRPTETHAGRVLADAENNFKWNAQLVRMLTRTYAAALTAVVADRDLFHRHCRGQCTCGTVTGDCVWLTAAKALAVA